VDERLSNDERYGAVTNLLTLASEGARGRVCYRIDAETGIGSVMGAGARGGAAQGLAGGEGGRESDVDRTITHRLTGLPHSRPDSGPRLRGCRPWRTSACLLFGREPGLVTRRAESRATRVTRTALGSWW